MSFHLNDKIAVITGAGSGIGRAIAIRFAAEGATVYPLDINESAAEQTARDIRKQNGSGHAIQCDITRQEGTRAVFDEIVRKSGRLDILVNSAGIAKVSKLDNTTEADFENLFNVNVKGTYNCMLAAIGAMKKQKKGVILNLASVAAQVGVADRFAYSMTKGAVVAMTYSVAKDYVKEGIRCNCISPGRVHTPFVDGFLKTNYPGQEKEMFEKLSATQPIGRMANPEEIAHFALYLCSDEAGFLTGTDYPIDGGYIRLNS